MRSIIVGDDTLNCLSQEHTILVLEELALCDSNRDSLIVLRDAVVSCDSIQKTDSLIIDNLENDLVLSERESEQKDIQITSLTKLNDICEQENKRIRGQRFLIGGISGAVGVLLGLLLGLFGG